MEESGLPMVTSTSLDLGGLWAVTLSLPAAASSSCLPGLGTGDWAWFSACPARGGGRVLHERVTQRSGRGPTNTAAQKRGCRPAECPRAQQGGGLPRERLWVLGGLDPKCSWGLFLHPKSSQKDHWFGFQVTQQAHLWFKRKRKKN